MSKARKAGVWAADPHKLQVPIFLGLVQAVFKRIVDEANRVPVKVMAQSMVASFLNGVTRS